MKKIESALLAAVIAAGKDKEYSRKLIDDLCDMFGTEYIAEYLMTSSFREFARKAINQIYEN